MKRSIIAYIALVLLAFGVNAWAMGGGQDQQQQQQQPTQQQPADQQQQPMAGEQQAGQQTFTGTVDRAGDNWVLIMDGTAYELNMDDEDMLEGMMGQQVQVMGTLDGQTIEADSIQRAGQQ
jgi:hypothetical protein